MKPSRSYLNGHKKPVGVLQVQLGESGVSSRDSNEGYPKVRNHGEGPY